MLDYAVASLTCPAQDIHTMLTMSFTEEFGASIRRLPIPPLTHVLVTFPASH